MGMGLILAGLAAMLFLGGKKGASNAPAPLPNAPKGPIKVDASDDAADDARDVQEAAQEASKSGPFNVDVGPARVYSVQDDKGPVGANPTEAKRSAQSTADHVRNKGTKYNRALLAAWQALAGLSPDGLYGPATVSKLRALGAKNVIGPLFKGAK